jgi:hypothetical protein
MNETAIIRVRDWVGDLGALKPADGERLAKHLIERAGSPKVSLDFADVGTLTSGFANAFFVVLGGARPLAEWRDELEFVSLASRHAEVLARSLRALRNSERSGAATSEPLAQPSHRRGR